MYNDKGNTKYLKLLKQNYSSSQDVIKEIVNLSAIINLPKGTEFFLSDIHGEYEAFLHIMNNCSGVIKEKVDLIFKDTISDYDRQELCTLIYYPREKMALLDEQGKIDSDWYAMTLNELILVAKLLSSKYTRSKVRKALPEEYAYIIDELLHAQEDEDANQVRYHKQILKTIIDLEDADEFIIALSALIKRLAVDHLHIVEMYLTEEEARIRFLICFMIITRLISSGAIMTFSGWGRHVAMMHVYAMSSATI